MPGIVAELRGMEDAADAARRADRLAAQLAGSRTAAQEARESWLDARERWVQLRADRLDGMAAELAAQLAEGAGCPVCGAVEHPSPAVHDGPVVTAADEAAARTVVETTEAAAAASAAVVEEQDKTLAGLRARAGGPPARRS